MTITDTRYCYYRDDRRQPRITLCAVRYDDGRIGYGWAIAGPDDRFSYENWWEEITYTEAPWRVDCKLRLGGKALARGRAEVAVTKRHRGIPCCDWRGEAHEQYTVGVLGHVWRYARPVKREEAIETIYQCNDEESGFLRLIDYGDVRYLPKALRPEAFVPKVAEPANAQS